MAKKPGAKSRGVSVVEQLKAGLVAENGNLSQRLQAISVDLNNSRNRVMMLESAERETVSQIQANSNLVQKIDDLLKKPPDNPDKKEGNSGAK